MDDEIEKGLATLDEPMYEMKHAIPYTDPIDKVVNTTFFKNNGIVSIEENIPTITITNPTAHEQ